MQKKLSLSSRLPVDKRLIQGMSAAIAILSLITLALSFSFLPGQTYNPLSFAYLGGAAIVFLLVYVILPRIYFNETFLMLGDALYIAVVTYSAYQAGEYGILMLFLYFVIIVADALKYPLSEYVFVVLISLQAAFFYIIVGAPFSSEIRLGILILFTFCTVSIAVFVWYFVYQSIYERSMRYVLERKSNYLKTMNDHLKAVDTMRTGMLRVTSHEFQTPLAAIRNSLDLMRNQDIGKLSPKQLQLVKLATSNNERLTNLVHELLNSARIESGEWKPQVKTFSLVDMIQGVVEEYKPMTQAHKQKLIVSLPRTKYLIKGDQEMLRIAIKNLVDNASKYTHDQGTITVTLTDSDKDIILSITDTGIGIKKELLSHLFSQFYRADAAIEKKPDGYGIGLYHSQAILKRHGGKITVISEEGKGSTFEIHLPLSVKVHR